MSSEVRRDDAPLQQLKQSARTQTSAGIHPAPNAEAEHPTLNIKMLKESQQML